jgi:hypothetical protein
MHKCPINVFSFHIALLVFTLSTESKLHLMSGIYKVTLDGIRADAQFDLTARYDAFCDTMDS